MKRSRLRDLKGKEATILPRFGYVNVANQGDVILAHCIYHKCLGLFICCNGGIWLVLTQVGHYKYFSLITILLVVHPKMDPS